MSASVLVWFRDDLRLADNGALAAAVRAKLPVVPVFVWSPGQEHPWEPGGASRWWLGRSLHSLDRDLRARGARLIVRRGPELEALRSLAQETGAATVYCNRRYETGARTRDEATIRALAACGIAVETFNASLLLEPPCVTKNDGTPYVVFTAFHRACLSRERPALPLPAPRRLRAPERWPDGLDAQHLAFQPTHGWTAGLSQVWTPGERGALATLQRFAGGTGISAYRVERDRPDHDGTSRLSPYLRFGEIGPRQLWHAASARMESDGRAHEGGDAWLRQLLWREFAHHLLHWFPHTTDAPLRREFQSLPWRDDARALAAWQQGCTGYPIVDAGMRQLWKTGWMHNRVRMIAASFLVKDLLLPWQSGARWFWDTLVDADLANNALGWQWVAGCGADAAPFFRIFNPVLQGRKFDPEGEYVRRWVPELARVGARWIHEPWNAPQAELEAAGIVPGVTYPRPIVAHEAARHAALAAYGRIARKSRT